MNLNPYQKNIFYSELLYSPSAVCCIGGTLELSAQEHPEEMPGIINDLLRLTPSIRLQVSEDAQLYECPYTPYSVNEFAASQKDDAYRIAEEMMGTPFASFFDHPLYEFALIRYEGGSLVFLKLHHLIADSVTVANLCRWADREYAARRQGHKICVPLPDPVYREMSLKKREQARQYFSKCLGGKGAERIADGPEEKNAGHLWEHLGMKEYSGSNCFAGCEAEYLIFEMPLPKKHNTAEFLLAVSRYLGAVSDQDEVVLGFVLGNRTRDEMDMPGMFANTLPLKICLKGGDMAQLVRRINWDVVSLMRFGGYSLDDLRADGLCTDQPFEVSVSYRFDDYITSMTLGEIRELQNGCVDVPIRISAQERKNTLDFMILYKKALFREETIRSMGEGIVRIYRDMEMNPGADIGAIPVTGLCDTEAYRRLNDTSCPSVWEDVVQCFEHHLSCSEALVWENGSESGEELYSRARRIAAGLKKMQAKRVGVRMERCREMVELILGILMAGAAFLVLRPGEEDGGLCDLILDKKDVRNMAGSPESGPDTFSGEDTAYMIRTSGSTGRPKCIEISRRSLMRRLEWANENYGLSGSILQKTINTFDVSVWEVLSVIFGARLCLLTDGDEKFPDRIADAVRRYRIEKIHFVPSMLRYFLRYVRYERITLPSLKEVYVSGEKLENGTAKLFFEVLPGCRLINYYGPAECTIDVTSYEVNGRETGDIPIGTPAANTRIEIRNDSGDLLPVNVVGEICVFGELVGKGYVPAASGSNKSSPEKAAGSESSPEESAGSESSPEKAAGSESSLEAAEHNDPSGEGLRNENLRVRTQGGFFEDRGERGYRTGDLGYLGGDGLLYICGRKDSQVKVHGVRLELSAIRGLILEHSSVENAIIFKEGDQLWCCYTGNLDENEIRREIAERISPYAVPARFLKTSQLPHTSSGKINAAQAKKIAEEALENERAGTYSRKMVQDSEDGLKPYGSELNSAAMHYSKAPLSVEGSLIFREVRKYINAGPDEDLLQAGLDSLSILEITQELCEEGIPVHPGDFYEKLTVRAISEKLQDQKGFSWLKNEGGRSLLICFPYAGGGPGQYEKLVRRLDCDVICMHASVGQHADHMRKQLSHIPERYERILIMGQCIGCMDAIILAGALQERADALILVAPSVRPEGRSTRSPWQFVPDQVIRFVLKKAGCPGKLPQEMLKRFRLETETYFSTDYRGQCRVNRKTKAFVVFGRSDPFTVNRREIVSRIRSCCPGPVRAACFRNGGHYLSENDPKKLASFLQRLIRKPD